MLTLVFLLGLDSVGAGTEMEMNDKKAPVEDALHATRAALVLDKMRSLKGSKGYSGQARQTALDQK